MSSKSSALEAPTQKAANRTTLVQPYVFFNGRCDDAIAFYRKALGAEVVVVMRFKDAPPPPPGQECAGGPPMPANWGDKVMHAEIRIGATSVLASDGCGGEKTTFQGFALSLNLPNADEAARRFAALSEGGQVQMPLGPTFFAASFGMVVDQFGLGWMIYVAP